MPYVFVRLIGDEIKRIKFLDLTIGRIPICRAHSNLSLSNETQEWIITSHCEGIQFEQFRRHCCSWKSIMNNRYTILSGNILSNETKHRKRYCFYFKIVFFLILVSHQHSRHRNLWGMTEALLNRATLFNKVQSIVDSTFWCYLIWEWTW